MAFRYEWKYLTEDGLLKEPKDIGSYWKDSINKYGGFDTEEDACRRYDEMKKHHGWEVPYELVLVKIYKPSID